LQGSLSIERMCQLAQVSRSGFYRYLRERWPAEEELTLRSAIQDLALEHRWRYGYRRVTAELRQRGLIVNRKRVARLMREDNLLTVRDTSPFGSVGAVRGVQIYLNLPSRSRARINSGSLTLPIFTSGQSLFTLPCFWTVFLAWSSAGHSGERYKLNFHFVHWSKQSHIANHRLESCTTPTRECSTFAGNTCRHSTSIAWYQA
jgi:hypothetical protein